MIVQRLMHDRDSATMKSLQWGIYSQFQPPFPHPHPVICPTHFVHDLVKWPWKPVRYSWLVVFRINIDLAIFQPYLDLEAGDNQSLKIQVARPGIEPRSSCSASQELNHSATTAPTCQVYSLSFVQCLILLHRKDMPLLSIPYCVKTLIPICNHKGHDLYLKNQSGLIPSILSSLVICVCQGSVPVDFLRPKFRVAHTKHDVISILMNKYTYINMYIIKKIISCIFILCWDITALLKLKWKFAGYV